MVMSNLSVVLTYHWFDEIKSGRKTHEYRERSIYWANRLDGRHYDTITFRRGYRKSAEKMTFEVKSITKKDGRCPHLPDVWDYYDIELGNRIDDFNK